MSQSQPPFIRLRSIEEVPEGTFKRFLIEAKEILLPKSKANTTLGRKGALAGRTPLCGHGRSSDYVSSAFRLV